MNILYINHYAGSPELGMAFRPYYLAKEWMGKGHNVLVVGASYSHLRKKQPSCESVVTKQKLDSIDYIWLKTPSYSGSGIKRTVNMFMFIFRLFSISKRIVKDFKPDVVIASSTYPLDVFPASRIAKLSKAKLVFETHDLWPLTPMKLGQYPKWHPFIIIMQFAEDYMCKKVDAVVSMLPYADKHYISRGIRTRKYAYIPNGIVKKDWDEPETLPEAYYNSIKKLKDKGCFLVGYAGGLFLSNAMEYVIDAMKHVKDQRIRLVILGSGQMKDVLMERANSIPGDKVLFLPSISKKAVPHFLRLMDVLVSSDPRSELYQYGVSPNKIYDYMMSEKPIISATEAANDIVGDSNSGLTVEPESSIAIAKAMDQLSSSDVTVLSRMGSNGKEYVLKNNEYSVLAEKFLSVLT